MTDPDDDLDDAPDGLEGPSRDLDPDERHQDSGTRPHRSRTFRFFNWLGENLMLVVGVGGFGAFLLATVLGAEIPRTVRIIGLVAFATMPLVGRPVASKAKAMLWDPSHVFLVDLDALRRTGGIFKMPSQQWQDWTVENGEPDWLSPSLACVKAVDVEAQTCEGTWRGTLSDRKLLTALSAIDECRNQLEEDAKKGFKWDTQAFVIVRRATRSAVKQVVSTFEEGTLPDSGDGITEAVDESIEEFGLERKAVADDDDPTSDLPGPDGLDDLGKLAGASTEQEVPADD